MKSLVRPELPTASVGSSQATTAAVDNSAPLATRPESTYKSGKVVQTIGATSVGTGKPYTTIMKVWSRLRLKATGSSSERRTRVRQLQT